MIVFPDVPADVVTAVFKKLLFAPVPPSTIPGVPLKIKDPLGEDGIVNTIVVIFEPAIVVCVCVFSTDAEDPSLNVVPTGIVKRIPPMLVYVRTPLDKK
jgi:hypothetical protein